MIRAIDIKKWGKLLIMLAAAVFLLSACSDKTTQAVTGTEAEEAIEQSRAECWQKAVLEPVYKTIGKVVMGMYEQLSAGSLSLIMIAFAVWMALRIMKFVSSVTEDSPGEVWNEIVRKAFLCLFCGFLASSSGMLLYVINTLIFPIYEAFLEFGAKILALSQVSQDKILVLGEEVTFKNTEIACQMTTGMQATLDGFPQGIQDMMGCMICNVAERLDMGKRVALAAMANGGLLPFVIGALVWFIFIVVSCGFVFYLIDSIFRFGMMILLLPIFIMSYAFGPTRKWTNIGFANIMNSASFMMAFSIILATVLMEMVALIGEQPAVFNPKDPEMHMLDFSITVMCLLLIGFLIFGSMQVSQQLTSAIIGGKVDAKFQQNLKAVGQMLVGIVTGGFSWVYEKTAFSEKIWLGRQWKSAGALNNKLKRWAGRDK